MYTKEIAANKQQVRVSETTQKLLDVLHDKKWVTRFVNAKSREDRVALLGSYNVQDQKEEAAIQFLTDKFAPAFPSITHVSLVRQEKEAAEVDNPNLIATPADERFWQEKLDQAAEEDLAIQKRIIQDRFRQVSDLLPDIKIEDMFPEIVNLDKPAAPAKPVMASKKTEPVKENDGAGIPTKLDKDIITLPAGLTVESPIADLKLGQVAQDKLLEAGISTVGQYFSMTFDQAAKVLQTPLVAAKHKQYFRVTPVIPNI